MFTKDSPEVVGDVVPTKNVDVETSMKNVGENLRSTKNVVQLKILLRMLVALKFQLKFHLSGNSQSRGKLPPDRNLPPSGNLPPSKSSDINLEQTFLADQTTFN